MKQSIIGILFQAVYVGIVMSFIEMRSHIMRSVLSILGVMLGVASLVAMLTLVGGIDVFINERMDKWTGSVWFWKKYSTNDKERIQWSKSPGLKFSDGEHLSNNQYVKVVPRSIQKSIQAVFGNQTIYCRVSGVDSISLESEKEQITIVYGSWFTNNDYQSGKKHCILSVFLAEKYMKAYKLTETASLINKNIQIGDNEFIIRGIVAPKKRYESSRHFEKMILIPLLSMQKHISGFNPDPGSMEVQVSDAKNVKQLSKLIASALAAHHRGVEDFEYRTADWIDKVTSMLNNVSILMTIISVMTLTIGGLSIMNVMLSSIAERIREIGIRKALGVTNIQIFIQFIAETTTLSLTGGIAGFVLGLAPLLFKSAILQSTQGSIEPTILPLHILFTFALVTGLGILFGLYPAIKASRMDPVDALRYE
ncbi:MAG: FtsX-like permease family protein [Fibrobacter sp.]|nr:FtsX-like permease family protein [Fibrobacter sp.]